MATPRVLYIYSNDGSELLKSLDADPTESIPIESDGFTTHYGSYTYSGNKKFIGLATSANVITPTYAVGDTFTLGTSYMSYTFYIVEQEIPKYTLRIDGVEVTDYENVIINGVSYKCKQASVPTNLTGYKVTVPSGWTASASYGTFNYLFNLTAQEMSFSDCYALAIGYENNYSGDFPTIDSHTNSIAIMGGGGYYSVGPFYSNDELIFEFTDSYDITDNSLIQWLVDNNATFEKESA